MAQPAGDLAASQRPADDRQQAVIERKIVS
jgi:hypothetical protein